MDPFLSAFQSFSHNDHDQQRWQRRRGQHSGLFSWSQLPPPPPPQQQQSLPDGGSPRQPSGTGSGVGPKSPIPPPPPPPPPQATLEQPHTEGIPLSAIDAGVIIVPGSPQRREKSPPTSVQQSPKMTPMIGVPGLTAFSAYSKTSSGGGAETGSGHSAGGFDVSGIQVAVPAGGAQSGAAMGIAARAEGSPASRKRAREAAAAAAGGAQGEGEVNHFVCSVCRRIFGSVKALFGHMRSHPNRGWKGAYPPPAFNAQEEFSDVPGLNRPPVGGIVIRETGDQPPPKPAAGGGEGGSSQADQPPQSDQVEDHGGTSVAAAEAVKDDKKYPVPDLNQSPPNSD